MKQVFENISKHIPLISILLMGFASVKLVFFYFHFHIPIFQFISFPEVLKSIIIQILFFAIHTVSVIVGLFNTLTKSKELDERSRKLALEFNNQSLNHKVYRIVVKGWLEIVAKIVMLYLYLIIATMLFSNLAISNLAWYYFALFVIFVIPLHYHIRLYTIKIAASSSKYPKFYLVLSVWLIYYWCFFVIQSAEAEVHSIKNHKSKSAFYAQTSDGEIFSSDNNYALIGAVEDYVFIYSYTDSTSIVLPKSDLKIIKFKRKIKTNSHSTPSN